MTRRGVAVAVLAALSLSLSLTACGIGNDESPRDIPQGDQRPLGGTTDRSAGAAEGRARIYLVGPSPNTQRLALLPVARDAAETPTAVIEELLKGANASELASQYRSAVPAGTQLRSASLRSGVLWVDLSEELLQLSGSDLIDALAQIVFTASELDGVRAVKVLAEGQQQQWPDGSGELQAEPFTVFDFPGLVASAQPAYPAVPTPTQP